MKTETLRGTAVTARVGLALGVAVAVCFVTGLLSHFIQHPQPWFFWMHPARPPERFAAIPICPGSKPRPIFLSAKACSANCWMRPRI